MPRFTARVQSGTLFNNIAAMALTPDPVADFCLLEVEFAFQAANPTQPVPDVPGVLEIQRATSTGSSPSPLTAVPCDPKAGGLNLVTPRFNYVTTPGLGTAEYRIVCPPRESRFLEWAEGEFVVPGGSFPLTFVHASGASMPSSTNYRVTVKWME